MSNNSEFLSRLQQEASQQAKLEQHRLLPRQIDKLSSLIARYSWQVILFLALVTALFVTYF